MTAAKKLPPEFAADHQARSGPDIPPAKAGGPAARARTLEARVASDPLKWPPPGANLVNQRASRGGAAGPSRLSDGHQQMRQRR